MLLENKTAVIYGAGGSLGGAVATALAKEGAYVFLTGKNLETVSKTYDAIVQSGGKAEVAKVDATSESEVNAHIEMVKQKRGGVDISYNAIYLPDLQGIPLIEMEVEDFVKTTDTAMKTHFITFKAAGKIMREQGSGVILSLTATPGGIGYPLVGGFGPACRAVESLSVQLASELGPYGVRVINMRSAGSPDSKPFLDAMKEDPNFTDTFLKKIEDDTMLKKLPLKNDIAKVAVMLCTDIASHITGVTIDITAGTTSALNYKQAQAPFV